MDNITLESFIDFCDDMEIVEEGLFDKFKKEKSMKSIADSIVKDIKRKFGHTIEVCNSEAPDKYNGIKIGVTPFDDESMKFNNCSGEAYWLGKYHFEDWDNNEMLEDAVALTESISKYIEGIKKKYTKDTDYIVEWGGDGKYSGMWSIKKHS